MIRLTEKEVRMLPNTTFNGWYNPSPDVVAKAQLKKVVEWMLDNELHPDLDGMELSGKSFLTLLGEIDDCKA